MPRSTDGSDTPFESLPNHVATGAESTDRTQWLVEHAASLRRIARVIASPADRAQLERMATTYEALAYHGIRTKAPLRH